MNYWKESVESSLSEAGVVATEEQIVAIAEDMKISHEQFDMAYGYDVASSNWEKERERELKKLRDQVVFEREKMHCHDCNGKGYITENFCSRSSTSECFKCRGEGRIHPSVM